MTQVFKFRKKSDMELYTEQLGISLDRVSLTTEPMGNITISIPDDIVLTPLQKNMLKTFLKDRGYAYLP